MLNVALVCIARNEDNYIGEWLDYNFKLGFDRVFVYQDRWECRVQDPRVVKIDMDDTGNHRQVASYNRFVREMSSGFTHAAFFDVDEFLVLKKHSGVHDFLKEYEDCQSLGINWVHFGDNGIERVVDGEYGVVKRFTMRRRSVSDGVKNILKLDKGVGMSLHHPHCPWSSTDRTLHEGAGNENGQDDVAQLNHYYCKTMQEFVEKKMIYMPTSHTIGVNDFHRYNFNEVEDLCALEFFGGK
jgi:hypothetical protein